MFIRWPLRRRQEAGPVEPSIMANPRRAELESALEILAEIFGIRTVEVEEMIQRRLEERSKERSMSREQTCLAEDSLWPATFCIEG